MLMQIELKTVKMEENEPESDVLGEEDRLAGPGDFVALAPVDQPLAGARRPPHPPGPQGVAWVGAALPTARLGERVQHVALCTQMGERRKERMGKPVRMDYGGERRRHHGGNGDGVLMWQYWRCGGVAVRQR